MTSKIIVSTIYVGNMDITIHISLAMQLKLALRLFEA